MFDTVQTACQQPIEYRMLSRNRCNDRNAFLNASCLPPPGFTLPRKIPRAALGLRRPPIGSPAQGRIRPLPMWRAAPVAQSGGMQTGRSHHVFIVDDSAPIRARLAEMLAGIDGLQVVGEAASAFEAIGGILRTRPHAVLLDLNLMGRTGLEVLRAVHPRLPETVFVVLTNHAEPQYRSACFDAGAEYFLDKSSQFDLVRDVLAKIASTHH